MSKLRSTILAAASVLVCTANFVPVQAQIAITVPAAELAATLQKTLGETTVHLHNKGPLANGSYHQENASSIKVPARVSGRPGQRTRFTIPDESRIILGRRYGYYLDHVRSTGIFVSAGADTFTLTITLAAQGPALVGTCVQLRAPVQPCATLGETALPPVEWKDARVDIVMRPTVLNRKVALDVQSVVIGGTFEVGKACEFPLLGARLCASINRQADKLRLRVAQQVKTTLNSDKIRAQVADGVRAYLDTTLNEPLISVASIDMAGGQVTIRPRLGR
jgi:hypothetical protein